ncbi:hypothetical protein POVWA2_056620 [Plasmodium ovale wallikeri]|uniref:Uncharacterized protein n=1 Tax=Plasmodium ovale wallikeri TaxID=864142 RepID=A0A1A8ZY20_PLAOA|nr:hypothetical protein POVWA1_057270 [Plasmodium ovale wallikeri]SBT48784.1 hypothetical protein POVWA2_056620 [Plasmodium ovale wallikeri]
MNEITRDTFFSQLLSEKNGVQIQMYIHTNVPTHKQANAQTHEHGKVREYVMTVKDKSLRENRPEASFNKAKRQHLAIWGM